MNREISIVVLYFHKILLDKGAENITFKTKSILLSLLIIKLGTTTHVYSSFKNCRQEGLVMLSGS